MRLKTRFFIISLHTKITILIFTVITLFISSTFWIVHKELINSDRKMAQISVTNIIKVNKNFIIQALLENNYWQIYQFVNSLSKLEFINSVGFINTNGKIIAHTNPQKFPIGSVFIWPKSRLNNFFSFPILSSNIPLGKFVIMINLSHIKKFLNKLRDKLMLFIFLEALISFGIGYLISSNIVSKLKILSRNAQRIIEKDWEHIEYMQTVKNDEISKIMYSLEYMVIQVKEMIYQEEQLKIFYHTVLDNIQGLIVVYDSNGTIVYHNNDPLITCLILNNKFVKKFYDSFIETNKTDNILSYKCDGKSIKYLLIKRISFNEYNALTISDVTRLKELEERQCIINSFELVGEISVTLAHEIKNFLQPLKLILFHGTINSKDLERVRFIIEKIDNYVIQFLQTSKSTELDLARKVSINIYIEEILFMLSDLLVNKEIMIEKSIENDLKVFMNPKDIRLILINLIKNAIEASPQNGTIFIGWRKVDSNEGCLTIRDTGTGILPRLQKEIAKPFFTTKKNGTGIGLHSVYKIVYLHRGDIKLNSHSNKTEFLIYLPLKYITRKVK